MRHPNVSNGWMNLSSGFDRVHFPTRGRSEEEEERTAVPLSLLLSLVQKADRRDRRDRR